MELTDNEIRDDIQEFRDRIVNAKDKLSKLPAGSLPYLQHKAREKALRDLQGDIAHFEQIIVYAKEGLIDG